MHLVSTFKFFFLKEHGSLFCIQLTEALGYMTTSLNINSYNTATTKTTAMLSGKADV